MSAEDGVDEVRKLSNDIGIATAERAILDTANSHFYGCDCDICLEWWAICGPDGGDPGSYGPFTKEQVNELQRELGKEETP